MPARPVTKVPGTFSAFFLVYDEHLTARHIQERPTKASSKGNDQIK